MSIESSLDPQSVEETRQQIRTIVAEIAQLAKAEAAPEEFYGQFLPKVVSAMAATGGAVWTVNDEGRLALQYQINLQETRLRDNPQAETSHARLLYKTLGEGENILAPPHSGTGNEEEAANPTEFLLVLGVLKTDLETCGVVEIFQRADTSPNVQKGYLRFLAQMCELAGEFLKSHQLRHFSHRQTLWTQLEDFCNRVHAGLDLRATAYTIANEGRRLLECDRLTVAVCKGKRCVVEAVSGQDVFDRRANSVRLLEKLATAVVATGDAVWYTGDTRDMAPQVEEAVEQYVDEAHSKTVAVLPLKRPSNEETEPDKAPSEPSFPIGALVIEQIEDSRVPPGMMQRVEVVARHSATAMANATEHNNLFLMPLWRAIGRSRWVVASRNLSRTSAVALAVLAVLVFLVVCPWPFKLEAKATLEPVERRNVYAAAKGRVSELFVHHGAMVEAGQLLAQLRDTELEMSLTEIEGQKITNQQRIINLGRELLDVRGMSTEDINRKRGDLAEAKEKAVTLDAQLALAKQKQKDLEVRSPIAGQVITWDLENRLHDLPVQRGQMLMQVADPAKDWQLELRMPEHRVGYVAQAYRAQGKDKPLGVDFQLATAPGSTFRGEVTEIHLSAEVQGEEGNTVLMKVKINKDELPSLRPGMTATAKVDCGWKPIGYVWFHDVVAFFQTRVFFRYF